MSKGLEALFDAVSEEPPSGLRLGVLADISGQSIGLGRWSVRTWMAAAAVAAMLAVVSGIAAIVFQNRVEETSRINQVLTAADANEAPLEGIEGRIVRSGDTGVLITHELAEPPDDRTYQLWVISGDATVPAGIFRHPQGASVVILDGEPAPGIVVGVTEEPAGRSDPPTGEVLAAARL